MIREGGGGVIGFHLIFCSDSAGFEHAEIEVPWIWNGGAVNLKKMRK
jgi:hypothetical protein